MIILNKLNLNLILSIIDRLFDKTKMRVLGPTITPTGDKRINVKFIPHLSLPGIFTASANNSPNIDLMETSISVTNNYIDKYKNDAKAKVSRAIEGWIQEVKKLATDEEAQDYLNKELKGVFDSVTAPLETVVRTEAINAQNVSKMDEIIKVNSVLGISDPVVFFICKHDSYNCSTCKDLHLLEDEITPRLWYLSELSSGYFKKGQTVPSILGIHPRCRCCLTTLAPSGGFDENGKVTHVKIGFNAIGDQRK